MRWLGNNKGQAVIEMAVLGMIILFVFGLLLSFSQMFNDQQDAQMEAFRVALQRACSSTLFGGGDGAGKSVDLTLLRTRRQVDLSDNFRLGRPTTVSGTAAVFWAVPKVGEEPENEPIMKINDDEPISYGPVMKYLQSPSINVPILGETSIGVTVKDIETTSETDFSDTSSKQEDKEKITTTRLSGLKDRVTTKVKYTVMPSVPGLNSNAGPEIGEEPVIQQLYVERDSDGHYQYKYNRFAPYDYVTRSRTWETKF